VARWQRGSGRPSLGTATADPRADETRVSRALSGPFAQEPTSLGSRGSCGLWKTPRDADVDVRIATCRSVDKVGMRAFGGCHSGFPRARFGRGCDLSTAEPPIRAISDPLSTGLSTERFGNDKGEMPKG
jgi:hypothetical protein